MNKKLFFKISIIALICIVIIGLLYLFIYGNMNDFLYGFFPKNINQERHEGYLNLNDNYVNISFFVIFMILLAAFFGSFFYSFVIYFLLIKKTKYKKIIIYVLLMVTIFLNVAYSSTGIFYAEILDKPITSPYFTNLVWPLYIIMLYITSIYIDDNNNTTFKGRPFIAHLLLFILTIVVELIGQFMKNEIITLLGYGLSIVCVLFILLKLLLKPFKRRLYNCIYLISLYAFLIGKILEITSVTDNGVQFHPFLYFIPTICGILVVLNFQLFMFKTKIVEREDEQMMLINMEKEKSLLIVNQLKPHFTFNALANIQYLCRANPTEASESIAWFGKYLRGNINSIKKEFITFNEEMDMINAYLFLEKMRFGSKIEILYDIEETTFIIPPLIIQSLVEYFVSYRISKQLKGGKLEIRTYANHSNYFIEIGEDSEELSELILNDGKESTMKLINQIKTTLDNNKLGYLEEETRSNNYSIIRITLYKDMQEIIKKRN